MNDLDPSQRCTSAHLTTELLKIYQPREVNGIVQVSEATLADQAPVAKSIINFDHTTQVSNDILPIVAQRRKLLEQGTRLLEANKNEEALALFAQAGLKMDPSEPEFRQQETKACILQTMGITNFRLQRYDVSEALLLQAFDMQRRFFGEHHPTIAKIIEELASIDIEQGVYERAERRLDWSIKINSVLIGPRHAEVGRAHKIMAQMYKRWNKIDLALKHATEALRIETSIYGPCSNTGDVTDTDVAWPPFPDVESNLNDLGLMFWKLGEIDQSLGFYEYVIAQRLSTIDIVSLQDLIVKKTRTFLRWPEQQKYSEHPPKPVWNVEMAESHDLLAEIYTAKGNLLKTIGHYQKSISIRQACFGKLTELTGLVCLNFGQALLDLGCQEAGLEYYQNKALIAADIVGPKNPERISSVVQIAQAIIDKHTPLNQQDETAMKEFYGIVAAYSKGHLNVAEQAFEMLQKTSSASLRINLGNIALPIYEESWDAHEAKIVAIWAILQEAYASKPNRSVSAEYFHQLLELRRGKSDRSSDAYSKKIRLMLSRVAYLTDTKKFEEAGFLLQRSVEFCKLTLPPTDFVVALTMFCRGFLQFSCSEYELCVRTVSDTVDRLGQFKDRLEIEAKPKLILCYSILAQAYKLMKDAAQYTKWVSIAKEAPIDSLSRFEHVIFAKAMVDYYAETSHMQQCAVIINQSILDTREIMEAEQEVSETWLTDHYRM